MNNLNDWESQLRSWTPRGPSEGLKKKLFGAPSQPSVSLSWEGPWRWLAPALGCLLVIASLSNPGKGHMAYMASIGTNNLKGVISGGLGSAAYLMTDFHTRQNLPGTDSFEWTNRPHGSSISGSLQFTETNSLIY